MCGRMSLFVDPDDLVDRFDADLDFEYERRYNVAPGDELAVVPDDREDTITRQDWGLVPSWADDPDEGPRPINARAETVDEKPTFSDAFERRRCLVLADGFYEWAGSRGSKRPYRVHLTGNEPFAMAGLWDRWENGSTIESVTVVTTDANDVVAPMHDRMPVILDPDAEREWLHADQSRAHELLEPYGCDDLEAYPISTAVNDPANDSADVLLPADRGEQSDFGDFGA
jgi:putative SOS response-associated peptidase YedK